MIRLLKIVLVVYAALLLQVVVLPAYFADPFQPDLLIIVIVFLGLREGGWHGGCLAFLVGLIHDCFSGIYLGLSSFSFLAVYLTMREVSDRLYTDNLHLTVIATFLATLANGIIHLLLLLLFSAPEGILKTVLPGLLPQALVNALTASLIFGFPLFKAEEEAR